MVKRYPHTIKKIGQSGSQNSEGGWTKDGQEMDITDNCNAQEVSTIGESGLMKIKGSSGSIIEVKVDLVVYFERRGASRQYKADDKAVVTRDGIEEQASIVAVRYIDNAIFIRSL